MNGSASAFKLHSPAGLTADCNENGSLRWLRCGGLSVNLFVANEVEPGPANLWLRVHSAAGVRYAALTGPTSGARFGRAAAGELRGAGRVGTLQYSLALTLAERESAWRWRVAIENQGGDPIECDLVYAQDLALAPYGAVRVNEYYVSQYVDHTPLRHPVRGWVIASRQNQPVDGRHPWSVVGSLRNAVAFATDALQLHGLSQRSGAEAPGLVEGLPAVRLQHEHSMVVVQDERVRLGRGDRADLGFFGLIERDHPAATSADDLRIVDRALAAFPAGVLEAPSDAGVAATPTLFSAGGPLVVDELDEAGVDEAFGAERRCEERDANGRLLSFFAPGDRHVVLRAKDFAVLRPHGHILRSGEGLAPDEAALTSTVWMNGVFHSMATQGHVSINRFVSTVHGYLGFFRAQGLRVFVESDGEWRLLDAPSAFEMRPAACRWVYRCGVEVIEVRSGVQQNPHALTLELELRGGAPRRCLLVLHAALNGDDGAERGPVLVRREERGIALAPQPGSELHARFPHGDVLIEPREATQFERVSGDELLFADARSRQEPYVCIVTAPSRRLGVTIIGRLVSTSPPAGVDTTPALVLRAPAESPLAADVERLGEILPWFVHNALVHFLAPRGLEQYTGGGWGTRDVAQGPVELLLAFGCTQAVRELLLQVMRAQRPDGDWPQWFMFFARDAHVRAGDSHGDVVFWPLAALAQYLLASGDGSLLDARAPFFGESGEATVWEHVQRALALIAVRRVTGTSLAAYGHGDWNDSLQPADPAMREQMCSAWTVTLHHQMLTTLARALRAVGRGEDAGALERETVEVANAFQALIVDDVLTGYALFGGDGVRYLLHPRDEISGVRYSSLAMIHAIVENLFTPKQARAHLDLLEQRLSGPDGVRLFDRPMPYYGGPTRLFQRAETATFFGREIGLMYMHAHLRYAQALAHLGEAERFFHALRQANPIGLREITPAATLRQANCYYSSSDAAFADRYAASADYERALRGEIALEGGWRVYSSGAGIFVSLLVRRLLGMTQEHDALVLDPVMPAALDGLRAQTSVFGRTLEVEYRVGKRGCGVQSLRLNGGNVPFARDAHPYRIGAARAARNAFESALRGDDKLVVEIG